MSKLKILSSNNKYNRFVNARDQALERMLLKTRAETSDILKNIMNEVIHTVSTYYPYMGDDIGYTSVRMARNLDHDLDTRLSHFVMPIFYAWTRLRKNAYILANAGEQQAITNCGLGKGNKPINKENIMNAAHGDTEFGSVQSRIILNLARMRRDIMDAVQLSKVLKSDWPSARKRILRVFPMPEARLKLKVLPRSYKETAKNSDDDYFDFNVSDEDWNEILNDYTKNYVPKWRDPRSDEGKLETPVSVGEDNEHVIYSWELERDVTNDFVQQVRDGENDGAKANGVTDFVWVAILDKKTDECCEERDGLTTSQIEQKVSSGEIDDGLGSAVPLHPSCRCRLVPAANGLEELSGYTDEDFQNWLES